MPWRLPAWAYMTFPDPVTLKRFLAPDLVFILGIWLSYGRERKRSAGRSMLVNERCVLGARRRHGSPNQPGDGRAPYGRAEAFWQWFPNGFWQRPEGRLGRPAARAKRR